MYLINDVTTDVQKPPQFRQASIGALPEDYKKIIVEMYPDLKPLRFPFKDRATVFDAMLVCVRLCSLCSRVQLSCAEATLALQAAAKDMPRWQLTVQDANSGTQTTIHTCSYVYGSCSRQCIQEW